MEIVLACIHCVESGRLHVYKLTRLRVYTSYNVLTYCVLVYKDARRRQAILFSAGRKMKKKKTLRVQQRKRDP